MINFSYKRPTSIINATKTFSESEDGLFLAGGQTLLPVLKQGLAMPSDIIDLGDLQELKGIEEKNKSIIIGAMTTHAQVKNSPLIQKKIPTLANLAGFIGDPHVRNLGTLGGALANNDPSADYTAAALGLGAIIYTDKRSIKSDEFFIGLFETALDPDEIIVKVEFPIPDKSGYAKFPNPASRYAIVGVYIAKLKKEVRVAITGASSSVYRSKELEAALTNNFSVSAINNINISSADLNSDIHASEDYRAHLIKVMAQKAVSNC